MNYWMMCGDWGVHPLNRREPRSLPETGRHYDMIILDDIVDSTDKVLEVELSKLHKAYLEALCLDVDILRPSRPGFRTATEALGWLSDNIIKDGT